MDEEEYKELLRLMDTEYLVKHKNNFLDRHRLIKEVLEERGEYK